MTERPVILVVDDDVTLLQATAKILDLEGFDTVLADNASQAVEFLNKLPVSAVIIDMFMPDQDGVETIREVLNRWPNLPIVAMSGGWRTIGSGQTLELGRALGASAVLAKPFNRDALLTALREAMSGG